MTLADSAEPSPAAGLPPWALFSIGNSAGKWAYSLPNTVIPPGPRIVDISFAFMQSKTMYALNELGIPDHLESGPKTAKELAPLVGADPEKLFRLLRLAGTYGFLTAQVAAVEFDSKFSNTALTEQLISHKPGSMKDFVTHIGKHGDLGWQHMMHPLKHSEDENEFGWMQYAGMLFWEWVVERPEDNKVFAGAMKGSDALGLPGALADYQWGSAGRFLDIGGASGSFLTALMKQNPKTPGVLFYVPEVIEQSKKVWERDFPSLTVRVTFVAGDFFKAETLPEVQDGDLLLLRWILHDWSDKKALQIMSNSRSAIGTSKARVVIAEVMPGLNPKMTVGNVMDMHMLVMCNGEERSEQQWHALLDASGFKLNRVVATRGAHTMIEAVPA